MKRLCLVLGLAGLLSCAKENRVSGPGDPLEGRPVTVEEVAQLFSVLPLGTEQMAEVHDAASASAGNGYDEEYLMRDLFACPGAGVGDDEGAGAAAGVGAGAESKASAYARPLRDLLREAVGARTKADGGAFPESWLDSLAASDIQIYWPFSQSWDGQQLPIVTFDPGDYTERNVGYRLCADGSAQKVLVDEQMAREQPVWVVSRNSDADFKSLEMRRREDPSWGQGGGDIVVRAPAPCALGAPNVPDEPRAPGAPRDGKDFKTLILRTFKANRQFDSWFAGASEFLIKVGKVEDFRAATEAELRLYQPSITDFMIVVRRGQVGQELPFNAVLVSEWTSQLSNIAFMCIEDDGGTRSTWKCSAMVKYNSKSYGFEIELPLNSRDDIVWRGSLTRSYIERYNGTTGNFGDVDLVLELI